MGDVHTAHCCKWHGCKYSAWNTERKCSVRDLGEPQEYPCEHCSDDWETYMEVKEYDPEWIKYITIWRDSGGYI